MGKRIKENGKGLMGAGLKIWRLQAQVAFWPPAGVVLGLSPL